MCSPLESGDLPPVMVNPEVSLDPVRDAILHLRERVEDLCNQELGKITKQGLLVKCSHFDAPYFLFVFSLFSSQSLFLFPVNDTTLFTLKGCKFPTYIFSLSV